MGMAGSLTHDILKGPPPPPIDRGWGGGGGGSEGRGSSRRASFTGLFVLIAASTMVFAAFTSAFVVRRGLSDDWATMPKPRDPVRQHRGAAGFEHRARSFAPRRSRRAIAASSISGGPSPTALGILFLLGQAYAWRELKDAGVYVSTNPASSFFYVLTASHAFHLLGGVIALVYVDVQALRLRLGPAKRTAIDVTAIFWHFLDGLWLYLMVLFYVWG